MSPLEQEQSGAGNVRGAINRHPRTALAVVGCLVVLFGILGLRGQRTRVFHGPVGPTAYFTCDDGATLFEDSPGKLPPFDHDGAEAVRAYCFPDTGGKRTVWYLEKWTDDGKRIMAAPSAGSTADFRLIKEPGKPTWLRSSDPEARRILAMTARQ